MDEQTPQVKRHFIQRLIRLDEENYNATRLKLMKNNETFTAFVNAKMNEFLNENP